MPTKIGIQSQNGTIPLAPKLLAAHPAAYLLLGNALNLGFAAQIVAAGIPFLILRTGPDWAYKDPAFNSQALETALTIADPYQRAGLNPIVIPSNEPVAGTPDEAKLLNDAQVVWSRSLKAHGFRTAAYCFSVGNPDYPLWPYLKQGIIESDGWLFLHQYGLGADHPEYFPDHVLRHRKVIPLLSDIPNLKIGITECLVDLGVNAAVYGHPGGFLRLPDDGSGAVGLGDKYFKHLVWFDSEIQKDPQVQFATVFGFSMEQPWVGLGFDLAEDNEVQANFVNWLAANPSPPPPPPPAPKILTDIQLAILVTNQKFPQPDVAISIILAESGGNPLATNTFGNTPPSTDRGLWQINDHWHPEVSDACAFDPVCSTTEAFRISSGGTSFNAWSSYQGGTYSKFLLRAQAALRAIGPQVITPKELTDNIPALAKFAIDNQLGPHQYGEVYPNPFKIADGKAYVFDVYMRGGVVCEVGDWGNIKLFNPVTGEIITKPLDWPWGSTQPGPNPTPVPIPFTVPPSLVAIGASAIEGTPIPGQPFYRLTGCSTRQGVSAFCRVTIIGKGAPAINVQVVNLFPDNNGEILLTDGSGSVQFNYGATSAFTPPAPGPFTVGVCVGAIKTDGPPKVVKVGTRLSDTVVSLGDPGAEHTETYLQYVQI